jgi:hypothetical protein
MMSLYSNVNLDVLAKEVVESVYAGLSCQRASSAWIKASATRPNSPSWQISPGNMLNRLDSAHGSRGSAVDGAMQKNLESDAPHVAVYLDIDPSVPWTFYTQPGAIRRIIMNLFGNSLKYTSKGSIIISLTQAQSDIVSDESPEAKNMRQSVVNISVLDSGKGISVDYLRSRLFTPFSQEDHLAPGAGLGLSMVKQITSALGGQISVESRVGFGTTVRVSLSLRQATPSEPSTSVPSSMAHVGFASQTRKLEGKHVCLMGFPESKLADVASTGSNEESFFSSMEIIERICRSWFHMKSVPPEDPNVSIYVCTLDAVEHVNSHQHGQYAMAPVVVICDSALAAHALAKEDANMTSRNPYEFLSQP